MALLLSDVGARHASFDGEAVRPQAATTLRTLIESVTIHPTGAHAPAAEVVA